MCVCVCQIGPYKMIPSPKRSENKYIKIQKWDLNPPNMLKDYGDFTPASTTTSRWHMTYIDIFLRRHNHEGGTPTTCSCISRGIFSILKVRMS